MSSSPPPPPSHEEALRIAQKISKMEADREAANRPPQMTTAKFNAGDHHRTFGDVRRTSHGTFFSRHGPKLFGASIAWLGFALWFSSGDLFPQRGEDGSRVCVNCKQQQAAANARWFGRARNDDGMQLASTVEPPQLPEHMKKTRMMP